MQCSDKVSKAALLPVCVGDSYLWNHLGGLIQWRLGLQTTGQACQKGIPLDVAGMSLLFIVHRVYYYVHSSKLKAVGTVFMREKSK